MNPQISMYDNLISPGDFKWQFLIDELSKFGILHYMFK